MSMTEAIPIIILSGHWHPFDLAGIVRVSPLHCHGVEDIDTFLRAAKEIAAL